MNVFEESLEKLLTIVSKQEPLHTFIKNQKKKLISKEIHVIYNFI